MHEHTRTGSVDRSVTGMVSDLLTTLCLSIHGQFGQEEAERGRSHGAEEGAIACRRTYGEWTRGGEGRNHPQIPMREECIWSGWRDSALAYWDGGCQRLRHRVRYHM